MLGSIGENKAVGPGLFRLQVELPGIDAQPGQFAHIKVQGTGSLSHDPLLRRPLSIADLEGHLLTFYYQVRGRGTSLLAKRQPGEEIDLLVPLGRGFELVPGREPVLIGGGLGVAPLLFLARRLVEQGLIPQVLVGFARAEDIFGIQELENLGCRVAVSTECGTVGCPGLVTQLLPQVVTDNSALYACGPKGMLAQICREYGHLPIQVSLEEIMACGIGACLGCACPKPGGDYVRVCREGPVFRGEDVAWEI